MSERPLLLPLDAHDRAHLAQVHPQDWKDPLPHPLYNLVVLGGGPAGLVCALGAAGLGARVALVERGLLGGDCLNVGCVPSKALLRSARAFHDARRLDRFGAGAAGDAAADFAAVMERVRRLRASLAPADSAARLAGAGVHVFLGDGRFVADDAIEVNGATLRFARAVIATGGRSTIPPVPGLAEIEALTNETVFNLTELPRRLALIGAGPIGCELGQAFRRLGAEVTFVSLDPRPLPREDPDAAAVLSRAFAAEGIRLHLGAEVVSAARRGAERVIRYRAGGGSGEVAADQVLVAIGRSPNLEGLDLERAGIAAGKDGIKVDDRLRTTNLRVFAAGDVCALPYKFTHAADAMARLVLANALFHGRQKVSRLVIPWVTYTDPEIAHVGLHADEARSRGIDADTLTVPLQDVDRAVLEDDTEGFARVHVARRGGRILGATVASRGAGEVLAEVVLAMTRGVPLPALSATIHAYPTVSSVWQRLADQKRRQALTPAIKEWLDRWFRWCRMTGGGDTTG